MVFLNFHFPKSPQVGLEPVHIVHVTKLTRGQTFGLRVPRLLQKVPLRLWVLSMVPTVCNPLCCCISETIAGIGIPTLILPWTWGSSTGTLASWGMGVEGCKRTCVEDVSWSYNRSTVCASVSSHRTCRPWGQPSTTHWSQRWDEVSLRSFRIWNGSTGIPSLPLALFVVMPSKAHLTSHSRMSGSRWVITPLWLSGSWRSFLYSSSVYFCHLFLISSVSVRSIPFLSFIKPILHEIFPWYL